MDIDTPEFERLRRQAVDLRRAGRSRREIKQLLQVGGERLLTELLRGEPAPEWTKRPNAKDDLRAEARALRARGMSYSEIAAELGVSKSSCSLWLRDMPRPIDRREQVRRSMAARRPGYRMRRAQAAAHRWDVKTRAADQVGSLTGRELVLAGALVHWCEGARNKPHRRVDRVDLVNGDPAVIAFFVGFLEALGIGRDRWKPRVHIHERGDVEAAVLYWAEIVGMAPERFRKPAIKRHPLGTVRRRKEHYVGCLRIDVARSADLYRQIEGWALASMLGGAEARARWARPVGRNGSDLRLPNGAAAPEPVS
ncbi:helix-turn-helix domain-containing protein [Spirillospora sp. CA-253888]